MGLGRVMSGVDNSAQTAPVLLPVVDSVHKPEIHYPIYSRSEKHTGGERQLLNPR